MKRGTFLVTEADDAAVLRDVETGQVHALGSNPGVQRGTVLDATIAAEPPLDVTWAVETVHERRQVTVERASDRPVDGAFDAVAGHDPGDLVELDTDDVACHALVVPVERTEDAAEDVATDEATLTRAARLGATTVVVRAADGVVTVRYR